MKPLLPTITNMFKFFLLITIFCISRAQGDGKRCTPNTFSPPSYPYRYKFSVCTMVHDEGRYVEEWVAYHLLLNVDHFYIYNDRSTDNIPQVLAPYIEQGYVSLINWDGNQTVSPTLVPNDPKYTRNQRFALADCVYNHKAESEWFGIWDVDEFMTLGDPYHDIPSFVDHLAIEGQDEYHIPMAIFGASSHVTTPDGLVIENYHWRSNTTMFGTHPYSNKFTGKSLYKSGCAVPEVHWSPHLPDGCRLNYAWPKIEGDNSNMAVSLNHYFQKSWTDFEAKMAKWGWGANKDEFDKSMQAYSQFRDLKLLKYVQPLEDLKTCIRSG